MVLENIDKQTGQMQSKAVVQNTAEEIQLDRFDRALENYITDSGIFEDRDQTVRNLKIFYEKCGKIFAEDTFYEQRMCLFWDLCIFHNKFLTDSEVPETLRVPDQLSDTMDHTRYSLFKVTKVRPSQLLVQDQLQPNKIEISARKNQTFAGIHKSDFIQGFLYHNNHQNFLSHGLIIHPYSSKKWIKKFIKRCNLSSQLDCLETLCSLSKIHLRHMRHAHVAPERIYRELEAL